MAKKLETATFAAGCFWGVEETFRKVKGVRSTVVGYAGGEMENPTYEDVCSGKTGHAEAVQIKFNPKEISYQQLLEIFCKIHDPTQLNRQGPDVGTQYRSVIFFHNSKQENIARKSKEQMIKSGLKVVTEIAPFKNFYKAEEYHQKYLQKRKLKVCH